MKTIERGDVMSGKRNFFDHRNVIAARAVHSSVTPRILR
jgi:hypothetical protein